MNIAFQVPLSPMQVEILRWLERLDGPTVPKMRDWARAQDDQDEELRLGLAP